VALAAERTILSEDIAVYPEVDDGAGHSSQEPQGWPMGTPNEGVKLPVLERALVVQMLEKTDWNVSKAAKLLGLSRDMLRTRMEKYGLARPEH